MKNINLLVLLVFVFLSACSGMPGAEAAEGDLTPATPTPSGTAMDTATITPTASITPTATTTRVHQGPDLVDVPILLYHRIDVSSNNSQYFMPPERFEEQMRLLHDWEYTVISIELLLEAIKEGADLPPRPIIITFDDGDISVYETAFPIMEKYGLTGVAYIVSEYMGKKGYMNAEQIKELAEAGWEIGCHSKTHRDLTRIEVPVQRREIHLARKEIQKATGLEVSTFAYPFGKMDDTAGQLVHNSGYIAAMGLGFTNDQGSSNLFWLQRRVIKGTYDTRHFSLFLSWQGHPAFLPADVPRPSATASRTPIPSGTPQAP